MQIAISTGTFYQIPFGKSLELIKKAGFDYIELLQYWKGGESWEMAQNINGIPPKEVLKIVKESGLKISSLHDASGLINETQKSIVAESTYEYLEYGADVIPCIVFHTPHCKAEYPDWWGKNESRFGNELKSLKDSAIICLENLPGINGYSVPLLKPEEMLHFVTENDIYVNVDTTHYAQIGVDIVNAAKILKERTKAVHLSDYVDTKPHAFFGEGALDFSKFIDELDMLSIHALTIECIIEYHSNPIKTIEQLKQAYNYINNIVMYKK